MSPEKPSSQPSSDSADGSADASASGASARLRLKIRTPVDALAVAPVVLGFHPRDSVVLMTFGGRGFHVRIDLPTDEAGRIDVVATLTRALKANPSERAILVLYSDDVRACTAMAGALLPVLTGELGLEMSDAVRTDGERWWLVSAEGEEGPGTAYDLRSHPFTAEAVLHGMVVKQSREEIGQLLAAVDSERLASIESALSSHPAALPLQYGPARRQLAGWLRRRVEEWAGAGEPGGAAEVAQVLLLIEEPDLRDVVWGGVDRLQAESHLALWTAVLRGCPDHLAASPAALVALYAWLSGDGALAWTAIDRSLQIDPGNSLAQLVAEALDRAVPPSSWRPWAVEELLAVHG